MLKAACAPELREPEARGQAVVGCVCGLGQFPGLLPTAPQGPDSMSDWLAGAARHAAPSVGLLLTTQRMDLSRAGAGAQAQGVDRGAGGGLLGAPGHALSAEPPVCPCHS